MWCFGWAKKGDTRPVEPESPEHVIASVGQKIAEIRRELGWTQQQAAEHLRMPLKNLQRIETGMNLTLRTLVRIARGLGVPARQLLDPLTNPQQKRAKGRPPQGHPSGDAI
jgi:transcriptional regulator with XRE-family HTH domain